MGWRGWWWQQQLLLQRRTATGLRLVVEGQELHTQADIIIHIHHI